MCKRLRALLAGFFCLWLCPDSWGNLVHFVKTLQGGVPLSRWSFRTLACQLAKLTLRWSGQPARSMGRSLEMFHAADLTCTSLSEVSRHAVLSLPTISCFCLCLAGAHSFFRRETYRHDRGVGFAAL